MSSELSLILFTNAKLSISFHKNYLFKHAQTICGLIPCVTIGRVCLKSPPSTIIIPPNLFLFPSKSCRLRSTSPLSSALWDFLPISQTESSRTFNGILNVECVVLSPVNSKETMPDDATIMTMLLLLLR
ncbi:hypothetical protein FRX31_033095 [Thalictrum thalictroides]|uniref:Uncharacterized protein n=1 Tax=Thalictrum thalictroides TaxID=46969 RepID=A0A7J6UY24_THATH|nr:hypothetical protein FRX31_033095 [Thalictrum thalictroides]